MTRKALFLTFFIMLCVSLPVKAAPWTDTFSNPVTTDQIYLFMVDGGEDNVTFQGWDRAPYSKGFLRLFPHSWDIDIDRQDLLSASGRDFGTSWLFNLGYFDVNYSDDQNDFKIEYAYLLEGTIVASGTRRWNAGAGRWDLSSDFSSTIPNPIGGTVWLLASGLLAMVGIRRRKRLDA
ncbi:MAG: hypothetical protein QNJ04_07370 [Desulfobacterales bacterium]|nr:hypothetical protein [Desulfobacterales bacterium]